MGKYTEQAKLAAVKEYCAGKAGLRDVAHRHDVDFSCLRQWVAAYQIHGVAGLQEKNVAQGQLLRQCGYWKVFLAR
ncbi:Transposase [Pseudomonas syringae pv. syringae HS191]|nr:Transposase [Pseudomonas syringae pv. syringae HS191]